MKAIELKKRCDEIILLGNNAIKALNNKESNNVIELFRNFKTSVLSFTLLVYGKDHPYFENAQKLHGSQWSIAKNCLGILDAIKSELEGGWLTSLKGLVSAEIFADFLEMADHLLQEMYKDPAAVMIGGVLEEHLRQLCIKNNVEVETQKEDKSLPKKADQLNSDLCKAGIYNKLDQKSVTSWLDLRNKAAHGKYNEYSQQQVELMLQSVLDFINRNPS